MAKKLQSGTSWRIISQEAANDAAPNAAKEKHRLRLRTEKRSAGKIVTIITPFQVDENTLRQTLKALKRSCGCGGTINNDSLELQGDMTNTAREWLRQNGWGLK